MKLWVMMVVVVVEVLAVVMMKCMTDLQRGAAQYT